jgi:hypothetical protein
MKIIALKMYPNRITLQNTFNVDDVDGKSELEDEWKLLKEHLYRRYVSKSTNRNKRSSTKVACEFLGDEIPELLS